MEHLRLPYLFYQLFTLLFKAYKKVTILTLSLLIVRGPVGKKTNFSEEKV
jgi:hypothetical protein